MKHYSFQTLPHVAWTGGSKPDRAAIRPGLRQDFGLLVRRLFREQVREYAGFWHDLPLHVARVFWGRAIHDAWATIREAGWVC